MTDFGSERPLAAYSRMTDFGCAQPIRAPLAACSRMNDVGCAQPIRAPPSGMFTHERRRVRAANQSAS